MQLYYFYGRLKHYLIVITGLFYFVSFQLSAAIPADVQAVFDSNGCTGCHDASGSPSGGLSLVNATVSEVQLVDVNANCTGIAKRVVKGDPDNSALYRKISTQNPGCPGAMPAAAGVISAADQKIIYDWIVAIGPAAQSGLIDMASPVVNVNETESSVTLTVNRALGTTGIVTIDYAVSSIGGDNAVSPDDYIADTGTLTFADGENVKTIIVTLVDDLIYEGARVFSVSLNNITGGAVAGSQQQTKVTIVDNEFPALPGTFLFGAVNYSVSEAGGSLSVNLLRTFGATGTVTVNVVSSNGSATAGMDFSPVNQTIEFAEGVTSSTINISVLEDLADEGNENFNLSLSGPTNGALLGSVSTVSITITDNDSSGGGDGGSGGSGGGGSEGGGNTGGGSETGGAGNDPAVEAEYSAAGSLFYLLPFMCVLLLLRVFVRV